MLEETTYVTRTYEQKFFLDEGKLRKMVDTIVQRIEKRGNECQITFEITRRNKSKMKTRNIEDLFDDDNTKGREVISLALGAREILKEDRSSLYSTDICSVSFNFPKYSWSTESEVQFSVTNKDKGWCLILAEDLDAQIKRSLTTKRLLGFVSSLDILFPFLVITLVFLLWTSIFAPTQMATEEIGKMTLDQKVNEILQVERNSFLLRSSVHRIVAGAMVIVTILMSFLVLLSEIEPFKKMQRWFDRSVFYWGDQKEIYDKHKALVQNIKWTVIIGFIVSALAGAFIAFFHKG